MQPRESEFFGRRSAIIWCVCVCCVCVRRDFFFLNEIIVKPLLALLPLVFHNFKKLEMENQAC